MDLRDLIKIDEAENLFNYYRIYKKSQYKVNIFRHEFSKVDISIENQEIDIYVDKDIFDYFMELIDKYEGEKND